MDKSRHMVSSDTDQQLFSLLKERINRYFAVTGKSRKADTALQIKILIIGIVPVAGYTFLLLFGDRSIFAMVTGYMVYFIGSALFLVNVAHDASHQAISSKPAINQVLSFSWNIVGISKYLWEIKHHHSHHIYTNIPHEDVDIAESPLFRFSPVYPYKNYYRYQYLYAIPLYGLFGIYIVFVKDFVLLFSKHSKSKVAKSLPSYFLSRLILTKLLYLTISYIIPLILLPWLWWQLLLVYCISLAVGGGLMLLVLVVPHINEKATLADNANTISGSNAWVLHQIKCTVDSSPDNQVLGWFCGGLNTHLIHHLFPNISHTHYVDLTRIVKQTLHERGITYHEQSFGSSIVDHFKYLRMLGRPMITVQQMALFNWMFDFIRDNNL